MKRTILISSITSLIVCVICFALFLFFLGNTGSLKIKNDNNPVGYYTGKTELDFDYGELNIALDIREDDTFTVSMNQIVVDGKIVQSGNIIELNYTDKDGELRQIGTITKTGKSYSFSGTYHGTGIPQSVTAEMTKE